MSGESSRRGVRQETVLSCQHKHVVLVGSDETGVRSARCADCRAPLTRRIACGEYTYFRLDDIEVERASRRPAS